MIYRWFKIFNVDEFLSLNLPSREYEFFLEGIGLKKIMVVSGINISIVYEGVMLTVNLNGRNPFSFDRFAVYLDEKNDVWLGIPKLDSFEL